MTHCPPWSTLCASLLSTSLLCLLYPHERYQQRFPPNCCNDKLFQFLFTKNSEYESISFEEHLKKCEQYLEPWESKVDFCSSKGEDGKCTCLHNLRESPLRQQVARYLVGMLKDCPEEKKFIIIEWNKFVVANQMKTGGKLYYPMPSHAGDINLHENDGSCSNTIGVVSTLKDAKVCQQGMCKVMGVTTYFLNSIRKAVSLAMPVAPPSHGLMGTAVTIHWIQK